MNAMQTIFFNNLNMSVAGSFELVLLVVPSTRRTRGPSCRGREQQNSKWLRKNEPNACGISQEMIANGTFFGTARFFVFLNIAYELD